MKMLTARSRSALATARLPLSISAAIFALAWRKGLADALAGWSASGDAAVPAGWPGPAAPREIAVANVGGDPPTGGWTGWVKIAPGMPMAV